MSRLSCVMLAVLAGSFGCDVVKFNSGQSNNNPSAPSAPATPVASPSVLTPGSGQAAPGQTIGQTTPLPSTVGGPLTAGQTFSPFLSTVPGQGVLNVPSQSNPNVVSFNTILAQGFHIGNGMFDGSSCKIKLYLKSVVGTTFNFHFRVLQNGTTVTAQITSLCGVDTGDDAGAPTSNFSDAPTDFAFFMPMNGSSTPNDSIALTPSLGGVTFNPEVLNSGDYSIYVVSKPYTMNGGGVDNDDFIFGNVIISANQPVQGVDITASDNGFANSSSGAVSPYVGP